MSIVTEIDFPGIGYNEFGSVAYCFLYIVSNDRMCISGVTTDDQDAIGSFDFAHGIGHSTAAETGGQTGHRGRMSETGTVVYVICLHDHTSEFLCHIILFVSTLGRS